VACLGGGFDDRQNLKRIKSNGAGQYNEFDNIDSALSAFDTGHERLVMPEFDCQFLLAESCFIPGVDQRLAQSLLTFASDCFRHASHVTPADVYFGRDKAILKQRERIKRKTLETRRLHHRQHAA
jgi:hypothetical protein